MLTALAAAAHSRNLMSMPPRSRTGPALTGLIIAAVVVAVVVSPSAGVDHAGERASWQLLPDHGRSPVTDRGEHPRTCTTSCS